MSQLRPLVRLAMPVAISQVSDMVTVAADTIMVGRVGTLPLAAVTLGNSITIIGLLFAVGFTIAITPLAGTAYARRDMADMARQVKSGSIVSGGMAILITTVLLILSLFLDRFGAPADVVVLARPFYIWIVLSILPRIGFGIFKQTAEAMSNTRVALIVSIAGNLTNVALNWVFIYGNFGMPAMGAAGAGLATFLSRVLMVAIVLWIFMSSPFFLRLRAALRSTIHTPLRHLKESFDMGFPIAGQIVLEIAAFALGAVMMGSLGAVSLAAHQVAMNLAGFTFMVALGIGSAATIRISHFRGLQDRHNLKSAGKAALLLVLGYNVVTAIVFLTLRHWLPTWYSTDPAVIDLASHLLVFAGMFQLFDGVQCVGLGILRGMADVRVPTLLSLVAYGCISLPVSYLCAFTLGMGPGGIWIGYLVGLMTAAVAYVIRFRILARRSLPMEPSAAGH